MVQQRGGVRLKSGVGERGDQYERHADAVADLVVQGKSAEGLLDQYSGSGAGGGGIQRKLQFEEGSPSNSTPTQQDNTTTEIQNDIVKTRRIEKEAQQRSKNIQKSTGNNNKSSKTTSGDDPLQAKKPLKPPRRLPALPPPKNLPALPSNLQLPKPLPPLSGHKTPQTASKQPKALPAPKQHLALPASMPPKALPTPTQPTAPTKTRKKTTPTPKKLADNQLSQPKKQKLSRKQKKRSKARIYAQKKYTPKETDRALKMLNKASLLASGTDVTMGGGGGKSNREDISETDKPDPGEHIMSGLDSATNIPEMMRLKRNPKAGTDAYDALNPYGNVGEAVVQTGTDVAGGIMNLKSKSKLEKAAGSMQVVGGTAKLVKGAAEATSVVNQGLSNLSSKVGLDGASKYFHDTANKAMNVKLGAEVGSESALGAANAFMAVKDIDNIRSTVKDETLNRTEKALGVTEGLSKATGHTAGAVLGGYKAASAYHSLAKTGVDLSASMATAATVVSIAGVVTGSLEFVAGVYGAFKAGKRDANLTLCKTRLRQTLIQVHAAHQKILRQVEQIKNEIKKKRTSTRLTKALASTQSKDLPAIRGFVNDLQDTLETLEMASTLQRKAKEAAAKKIAGGTLAVVGGALALSGVGAPIVIGIAVAGALLKLGFAVAQYRRNKKANKYIVLSRNLSDAGTSKAPNPDEEVNYSTMQRRFLAAYYNDVFAKNPTGDKKLDAAIRYFGRLEKKGRIGKPKGYKKGKLNKDSNVRPVEEIQGGPLARQYWAARSNEVEQSSGGGMFGDFFKPNVTKSAASLEVSKQKVAHTLNHIAWNTFNNQNPKKPFFDISKNVAKLDPGSIEAAPDQKTKDALRKMTDAAILQSTSLSGKPKSYQKQITRLSKTSDKKKPNQVTMGMMLPWVSKFVK